MLMEIMSELMGTWGGVFSFVVVIICAIAIPLGVIWALVRQLKGEAEISHSPVKVEEKHSEWHEKRYSHHQ